MTQYLGGCCPLCDEDGDGCASSNGRKGDEMSNLIRYENFDLIREKSDLIRFENFDLIRGKSDLIRYENSYI